MSDQSKTSRRTIFGVSRNAIFSPEAVSGASPPVSPDGPTSGLSGRAPVRARAKASPASASEPTIQGICGRTFIGSSVPEGRLSSWESRLRLRLARIGSTESALIWRTKVTPHGRSISRLAPSTRHINGNDCTGLRWPTTTTTRDWRSDRSQMTSEALYGRKGRPLSRTMLEVSGEIQGPRTFNPTPTVADVQGGRKARSGARSSEPLLNGLLAAYHPSPTSSVGGPEPDGPTGRKLGTHMAAYNPTPTLHGNFSAANGAKGCSAKAGNGLCTQMVATALSGPTTNGSSAPLTEKRGAPNPEFPFWLMGFSDEWTSGALEAMRSFRKSRQKSSPPISTPKPRRRIM